MLTSVDVCHGFGLLKWFHIPFLSSRSCDVHLFEGKPDAPVSLAAVVQSCDTDVANKTSMWLQFGGQQLENAGSMQNPFSGDSHG